MTTLPIEPLFAASGALQFAIKAATPEGKTTVCFLLVLSLFSWTIIITKLRQLIIARRSAKKLFATYNATRDPLDIKRSGQDFDGAPAYGLYGRGTEELEYQLKSNAITIKGRKRISRASFEAVKLVL